MDFITDIVKSTPVAGQFYGFVEVAKNVTTATNPTEAAIAVVSTVLKDCTPPVIKYPVKCAILALQVGTAVAYSTNPVMGLHDKS